MPDVTTVLAMAAVGQASAATAGATDGVGSVTPAVTPPLLSRPLQGVAQRLDRAVALLPDPPGKASHEPRAAACAVCGCLIHAEPTSCPSCEATSFQVVSVLPLLADPSSCATALTGSLGCAPPALH